MVSLAQSVSDVKACVPAYGESVPAHRVYETLCAAMGKSIHLPKDPETWKKRLDEAQAAYQNIPPRDQKGDVQAPTALQKDALYRVGDAWIYGGDALVRRAASLQKMAEFNQSAIVRMHPDTLAKHGLAHKEHAMLQSAGTRIRVGIQPNARMHKQAVWMPSGFTEYAGFSARSGQIDMEEAL